MYAKIISCTLTGIDARKIIVESDVTFGFPAWNIVGLPDTSVRESRERVRSAVLNSGYKFPDKRVTVNLSPADIKKEGSQFDLPIAISILISDGIMQAKIKEEMAFLGELNLDGTLNRVNGIIAMVIHLRDKGVKSVVIPESNLKEVEMVKGINIYVAKNLHEVVQYLKKKAELTKVVFKAAKYNDETEYPDFCEIIGQSAVKRSLQIAAGALHNILMVGPPGVGKTMMARSLPSIMPPLTYEEMLQLTKIYSIIGMVNQDNPFISTRPFRAPDHTISVSALIGGGIKPKPGETSLSHLGVLFLDEVAEFKRSVLESLRKPMEDEVSTISRLNGKLIIPSKFLLVASMNPCPCGYYGEVNHTCSCTLNEIMRYRSRLSGPFLDRIDLMITVKRLESTTIHMSSETQSSAELKKTVMTAWQRQQYRFKDDDIDYNSQMKMQHIKKYCKLNPKAENLLESAFERFKLSVRSYSKILKVSRTIADLENCDEIKTEHIAEAISYKCENSYFSSKLI